MSLNRSLLSQITKDLEDKKKPSKPNVPRNQWQHPGEVTKIPSNNITMQGVSYPVLGVPDVGPAQMMYPDQDYHFPDARNVTEIPMMRNGGYTVTRSNDRKGKTHKVTGPDGTVKYFGDSKLGQHPKDPERKKAFYARHKKNLAKNPYFRAFARATWQEGGETDSTLENIAEVFDPTGITSWDDVYRSYKETGMSPQTALEVFGALPLLGKAGKLSKAGIHLAKYKGVDKFLFKNLPKSEVLSKGFQGAGLTGRASDAVQAANQALGNNFFPHFKDGGDMIRRADGSYSKRGLWDNIRANRGSGKKPTKEMLEQERKIRAEEKAYGGQIIFQDGGFVDLKKQYNLEPLSKMGIEKAKELAAKNPNLKFVCTAEGCAQIAADAANAYGQNFTRSHAWDIGNKNNVEYMNPAYIPYMGMDAPLPDPKNYKVPQEVMNATGMMVGMNRKNNLYDKDHKKLTINDKNVQKGQAATRDEANDSYDYARRVLYPDSRLYEHMGYMVDKGRLLHGTGANKDHPAFYTIDNLSDGIALPGYGKYEAVETISPSSTWQKVLNKFGLRKKGGSTYSGGVWYQVGGIGFNPMLTQMGDAEMIANANADLQMTDQMDPFRATGINAAADAVFANDLKQRIAKENPAFPQKPKMGMNEMLGNIQSKLSEQFTNPYSLTNMANMTANFIDGINNQKNYKEELNKRRQNYSTDEVYQAQGTNDLSRGTYNMYNQFLPNQQGGNLSYFGMNQKYRQAGGAVDTNNLNMSVIPSELATVASPFINLDMPVFDMGTLPEGMTTVSDNTNVMASDMSTADEIAAQESSGNYKAYNPAGGGEGAVGKYQFRWTTHKNWIKDLTGVRSKEEFMNNPEAQEMAYAQWDKTTLTPKAMQLKEKYGLNLPLSEIKKQIHFAGPDGAERYYATGKETRDANGMTSSRYGKKRAQVGGTMELSHKELMEFLANGGEVEFM